MSLSITITTAVDGQRISIGSRPLGLSFSTSKNGFASCSLFLPVTPEKAKEIYNLPGILHLTVWDEGDVIWEGRVEDKTVVLDGLLLGAFGYWRAFFDIPYSAMWTKKTTDGFRIVTATDHGSFMPAKYQFDTNKRLYISLAAAEAYGNGTHLGALTWAVPHNSLRDITNLSCSYSMTIPANWNFRIMGCSYTFTGFFSHNTIVGTGALQTGVISLAGMTARPRVVFVLTNLTGATYNMAVSSGVFSLTLTNLQIKTTASSVVYPNEIIESLVGYVNGINPSQISSTVSYIEDSVKPLVNQTYEDEYPGNIINKLADLEGFSARVWERQELQYHPSTNIRREFFVDNAKILDIQTSLQDLVNSAYTKYKDVNNDTLRTGTTSDTDSTNKWQITRMVAIEEDTLDSVQAVDTSEEFVERFKNYVVRANIEIDRLFDQYGQEYPLYTIRAGDKVTLRNLTDLFTNDVDDVATFQVAHTDYDADTNSLKIEPIFSVPTLISITSNVPPSTGAEIISGPGNGTQPGTGTGVG